MINAGELDQRIILYRVISGKSSNGAPLKKLQLVVPTWAKVESGKSEQRPESDRDRTQAIYSVKIRWRENIEPGCWLQWRGKWLEINAVNDSDPHRHEMILDVVGNPQSIPPPLDSEGENAKSKLAN